MIEYAKGGGVMSCIFKIKEAMNSYTDTEKRLANYILENKEIVLNSSAQQLGENSSTSAAAIIRFSKKLGYKGFTELKVDLAKDNGVLEEEIDEIIQEEDSVAMLVKKAEHNNIRTVEQTYKLINIRHLEKAIMSILNAKRVYLFGVGGSGEACNDLMLKLTRLNYNVVRHDDPHVMLSMASHIEKDDVAIGISYSGMTKEVNIGMKYAKNSGASTIAITKFDSKNELSKLADVVLHLPNEEKRLRLGAISRTASLILTDLLYYGAAKSNITKTKEYLLKTKEITDELN